MTSTDRAAHLSPGNPCAVLDLDAGAAMFGASLLDARPACRRASDMRSLAASVARLGTEVFLRVTACPDLGPAAAEEAVVLWMAHRIEADEVISPTQPGMAFHGTRLA